MGKTKAKPIYWLPVPEAHDYAAAGSYLNLLFGEARVTDLVAQLRLAPIQRFKAKDLFRASALPLLGPGNSHVQKDITKIAKGQALAPLLLVREERAGRLVIADGYHRLCALYQFDEDARVPCQLV
jgi:hypothetical protein